MRDDGGKELGERGSDGERVEIIPTDAPDGEEIGGELERVGEVRLGRSRDGDVREG